jgi:CMP-N-acetylneuraminic acid synthetase
MMTSKTNQTVVALVPMRHHSQRIEGKNFQPIAGRPLYAYILETLLQCKLVSKVVVDTDSPIITEGIRQSFPQVEIIRRPKHLTADDVPMNDILLYDVEQIQANYYLQTHCTNPLLRTETILKAIQAFFNGWPSQDSLFSVTPFQTRLWTAKGEPVNHNPNELIPTQDLEPLLIENSCMYIFSREGLQACLNRIGQTPILFEVEPEEAVDIDTEWEFKLAEFLLRARQADA